MRQFIQLPKMYEGLQARRLKKVGRVELLRVFNDGAPYWFVRIAGFDEVRDRERMKRAGSAFGNGYWRFCHFDEACGKFQELASQAESLKEEKERLSLRAKNKQRALALMGQGKLRPFLKKAQRTA